MRSSSSLLCFLGLIVLLNVLYTIKSALGVNLLPGHNADFFPLGDALFRTLGGSY